LHFVFVELKELKPDQIVLNLLISVANESSIEI